MDERLECDLSIIPEVGYTDDLSTLSSLDEEVILEELRVRFQDGVYYTFIGDVLVAVNPYKPVLIYNDQYHEWYSERSANQKPHIFWVAHQVYRNLQDSSNNQCILVNGESGSGKTESTKLIVRHLVYLSSSYHGHLHDKIVRINPLLEAFGNARTIKNENSSRFGKYIDLYFDKEHMICSASISDYMLEKCRVINHDIGERNFHIFYYMLAGLTTEQYKAYCLGPPEHYRILKPFNYSGDDVLWTKREQKVNRIAFQEQIDIMHIVGFSDEEIVAVVTILVAILHLTNISFSQDARESGQTYILNKEILSVFCRLLHLSVKSLSNALVSSTTIVRRERVQFLKTVKQAENGRDALAKALYAVLFKWIVGQVNKHLKDESLIVRKTKSSVGILDMAGFENLQKNGFEQLCINTANEKLQQYFNEAMFVQEEKDYEIEKIEMEDISYKNNSALVDLFLQKPTGIFHIIDEESMFPGATDGTLKEKLDSVCSSSPFYFQSLGHRTSFAVNHYAGKVTYNVENVLERNRDGLSSDLVECVSQSENSFVRELASSTCSSDRKASSTRSLGVLKVSGLTEVDSQIEANDDRSTKSSIKPIQKRSCSSGNISGAELRPTNFVSKQFRRSLSELMTKVSDNKPWFVRCVKPNSKKEADIFDSELVRKQLKYNGLLEISRLRREGFAIRMLPEEFIQRYRDVSFHPDQLLESSFQNCEKILQDAGLNGYVFGQRKVFLRHWHRPVLQDLVSEKRKMMAIESNTVISDSETTDLDTTYDVVAESSTRGNHLDVITINASPLEEITVATEITTTSTKNTAESSSGSQQRNGHHVKISLPHSSERKLLDERLWDRFQMIPRERVSTSDTFRPFLRGFKFLCYILLFCLVLGSAVTSKLCILIMASSIVKDDVLRNESQSPTIMMLIISICAPYVFWVVSYTAKSLFGSSAWPSFKTIIVTLVLELLHTFGLCLLVFHILPRMDMARGLLNLCGIFTIPAFLKTLCIATDKSTPGIKRFTLSVINGIAFLIQFCNLAATTMFSIPLTESEKFILQNDVIENESILHSTERPFPEFASRIMWEIPVSLFLISLSYWENYVDGDIYICSFKIPFLQWKKNLLVVRQRLYIFAGLWKIGWTLIFAILLLPGFSFNTQFTDHRHENVTSNEDTIITETPNILSRVERATAQLTSLKLMTTTTELPSIPDARATKLLSSPIFGKLKRKRSVESVNDTRNGKQNSNHIADNTELDNNIQVNLTKSIKNLGIDSVLHLSENSIKPLEDVFRDIPATSGNKSLSNTEEIKGFVSIIEIPESVKINFQRYGPLYAQLIASALMSYFGSLACKLCMQKYGFTIPLFLATPITLGIVITQGYTNFIPSYLYIWIVPEMSGDLRFFHLLWLAILWTSQIIVTAHIWSPRNGRMAKIERLFVTPLRCGVLTDLSLMLRRRLNDRDFSLFNIDDDYSLIDDDDEEVHKADDVVPQIYACATMWHETRSEMTQLLKSLFRMDIDHSARYLAQKFYGIRDPDYYEFEAHIFFDDAMELTDEDTLVPNSFVAELIDCIDDALSSVHERQMQLGPPVRTPTPYGGRLIWRLPGASKLVVHLKDKHKIRHKKRWSQVMYMYYLLGYRILAQPENLLHREINHQTNSENDSGNERVKLTDSQLRHRRQASHFTRSVIFNYTTEEVHTQAENTFILTLDGDVDFKPDAVRLLVDRLKKNKKVGAACGRIHPVGSGPILWYQEFEYAIGHWLQKATEHVFGCVLCAPGCFSLFRGSALMDDNVARSYAIRANEAGHYVQYDQGEDRWLSTLLLQQGYRIDYCAAADALTHAPETFSEFFNQRRRWGPSTLANIVDLLGDWKNTVRLNDNISTPYILYQFFLLVSTILGPATVLLMMAGAFTVVFKTTVVQSYAISLVPAILFIIVCTYAKPSTQITIATILSACYAIVMTIVLVGTVGTAIEGDLTSPNVIFLMMLVIIFFIAALMHPEEFACVIPGALYFICIPTGYLVLTIYYLCNMHVVSWGTREVPKRKTREEILAEKLAEEEKRKKKEQRKGILGWLGLDSILNETVEMFRQIRTITLTKPETRSKTDDLLEELIYEIRQGRDQKAPPRHRSFSTMTSNCKIDALSPSQNLPKLEETCKEAKENVPVWLQNEDPDNPGWLQDSSCGEGPIKRLEDKEKIFWKQLLRKYLFPINEDKLHQEKVAAALKNLRNSVVFGFFMTSALWIALTMQLQLLQDEFKHTALFIKIPHFYPQHKELTFEPLGMMFLAVFSAILFFQFIGMLSHRWGTILHVLSITDVSCSQKFTEKYKIQEVIAKAMELQRVSNIENEPEPDYDDPIPDYEDDDGEEDEETMSSFYTDSSSSVASSAKPPSYHSQEANKRKSLRRKNSAVFNRRGLATGRTLRRAFERRYRNQLRREKSGESQQSDSGLPKPTADRIDDGFMSV